MSKFKSVISPCQTVRGSQNAASLNYANNFVSNFIKKNQFLFTGLQNKPPQTVTSNFLNGDHTEQLYCNKGRMRERYAVSLNFDRQLLRFIRRKLEIIDICLEKANFLSIWMSRHFVSRNLSEFLCTDYRSYGEDFYIHLFVLNHIHQSDAQACTEFKSLFWKISLNIDCFDLSVYWTIISKKTNFII